MLSNGRAAHPGAQHRPPTPRPSAHIPMEGLMTCITSLWRNLVPSAVGRVDWTLRYKPVPQVHTHRRGGGEGRGGMACPEAQLHVQHTSPSTAPRGPGLSLSGGRPGVRRARAGPSPLSALVHSRNRKRLSCQRFSTFFISWHTSTNY